MLEIGAKKKNFWELGSQQVKITQELKLIQAEQMTKLQAKHQAECDLLEDMR
ncbi:FCH and double SH3 domains 2 [Crotalus adamanteus]|uniref:FCH and double SH3 domains 2 n=1 Tax=Crotalus adamanteus TaxID=8729 RepID=A0AAW1BLI0_CROAD